MKHLFSLMVWLLLASGLATAQSAPIKIGRDQFIKAYVHALSANDLARGKVPPEREKLRAKALEMPDSALRAEILKNTDAAVYASINAALIALVDAATHMKLTQLALTSDGKFRIEEVRDDVRKHIHEDKNNGSYNKQAIFKKKAAIIHKALGP